MVPTQTLRQYQVDGIQAARSLIAAGHRRIILQLSTGGGKSSLAAGMIAGALSKGKHVLFLGHRRELISQPFWRLVAYGVPEDRIGVIMANGVITTPEGQPYHARRPHAPIQIATVQTLARRPLPPADLVFVDECFPAGTRVDGQPIETVSVGDLVACFDHVSGLVVQKPVRRIFRSVPTAMASVRLTSGQIIDCTPGHPFFTQRGYIAASELQSGDSLFRLPESRHTNNTSPTAKDLLCSVQKRRQLRDDGFMPAETFGSFATPGEGIHCPNGATEVRRLPTALQTGHRGTRCEAVRRSGREQPSVVGPSEIGQATRCGLEIDRVDSVAIQEPYGSEGFGNLCPDGFVYNLEVAEHHNYFADGILVHNCHHAKSNTHSRLIEHYSNAAIVGLTATPVRSDGKGLGDLFDALHCISSFRDLAELGYLATPRVYSRPGADLSGVRTTGGDYDAGQLGAVSSSSVLLANVVDTWVQRAEGRRTILFACTVKHSIALTERFVAAGIAAEHLDGETPTVERDAILQRLATGQTTVLCNVGVCTEGWDLPACKCVVLARATKSLGLFLQMAGRGLRPWGDVEPIILDHGGNVERHGFPQDDRTWTLEESKPKGEAGGEAPSKECPQCGARIPTPCRVCPACGYVFPLPQEAEGDLVEVTPVAQRTVTERRAWYEIQLADAAKRGYKLGWARHRYHEEVGKWPAFYETEAKYYNHATLDDVARDTEVRR